MIQSALKPIRQTQDVIIIATQQCTMQRRRQQSQHTTLHMSRYAMYTHLEEAADLINGPIVGAIGNEELASFVEGGQRTRRDRR
mmetsp:Transcript_35868/g.72851  ORF Transcript_35868/g.72851 Transcript_35868/m.72851 type:complete len:84 (-) Transcript_35868:354-605(-)